MMDLDQQIREYYEAIIDPVDVDRLATEPSGVESGPIAQWRGWAIAFGAALVVVVVIGGALLLLGGSRAPVGGDPPSLPTTIGESTTTHQALSEGWQRVAVGEAWVDSLIDVESLPEGGFIVASKKPWSLWWSPNGSAWYDADPDSLVTEYVRHASPRHSDVFDDWVGEVLVTPPLIATLGDRTVILDTTNVGMSVGYPRLGEWESIRFATPLSGSPRLLTIAASDTEVVVIGVSPTGEYVSLVSDAYGVSSGWNPIPFTAREQAVMESSYVGWLHDRWVVVLQHSDLTRIFASSDGETWTEVETPEDCCGFFSDMTIGPPGVLASSFFPYAEDRSAFSSDGLDWITLRPDSPCSAYSEDLGYVHVVVNGANLFSEDGRTWQEGGPLGTWGEYPSRLTASGRTLLAYVARPLDYGDGSAKLWAWFSG